MADLTVSPDLDNTTQIVEMVLTHALQGKRVRMLVPAGQARKICQRVRTLVTRVRDRVRAQGKSPQLFKLLSTIHPETHSGVRFDCIIWYVERNNRHKLQHLLESMEIE